MGREGDSVEFSRTRAGFCCVFLVTCSLPGHNTTSTVYILRTSFEKLKKFCCDYYLRLLVVAEESDGKIDGRCIRNGAHFAP